MRSRIGNLDLCLPEDYFPPKEPVRCAKTVLRRPATCLVVVHAAHGLGPNLMARFLAADAKDRFHRVVLVPGRMTDPLPERLIAAAKSTGDWCDFLPCSVGMINRMLAEERQTAYNIN